MNRQMFFGVVAWLAGMAAVAAPITPAVLADEKGANPDVGKLEAAKIPFELDDDGQVVSVTLGSMQSPFSIPNLKLVAKIKTLKHIRSEAAFDQFSNEKLAAIGAIKSLETLQIDSGDFRGSDLKKLATLPKLATIHFVDSTIDDNGAKALSTFKSLTVLKLDGNQISDAGLKALCNLKDLTELNVHKNLEDRQAGRSQPITDAGLSNLKSLKQLKRLNVAGNLITDAGLKTLSSLKTLEWLNVAETKVTADGIVKIKQALPECDVVNKSGLAKE